MKYFLFVIIALACASAAAQDPAVPSPQSSASAENSIQFSGGDGSSIAQAVVIENAKGEDDGVDAEYRWVRSKNPGFKFEGQGIITKDQKVYDRLEGTKADGTKSEFYFDITLFFGKF
jgi:hypothetical protein